MSYHDFDAKVDELLPLRDVVYKKLRRAILMEELKAGDRLTEIYLADKLGVSRTPIREAIRKLEQEGLVIMLPRRGTVVAEITEKSLKDVLEVRRVLDMLSAELACERMDEDGEKALEKACHDFERAVKNRDLSDIAQKDVALHNIIVEASGNNVLQQMINNLSEQMYRYRVKYLKDDSKYETLVKEHQGIYESIIKRDKKTAARLAKEHIDNQEAAIMSRLHNWNAD